MIPSEVRMPALPGVEHRWVDAGGLRMHVAAAGAGEPLLLLHGWPGNWFEFHKLIPLLAERFRVYAPDLRGWGWTDAPGRGYDVRTRGEDVIALLDALELREPVRLIGHDWGAFIALRLSLVHPARVQKVMALGGWVPWLRVDAAQLWAMRQCWYQPLVGMPLLGRRLVANRRFTGLLARRWAAAGKQLALEALTAQFAAPERALASERSYSELARLGAAMLFGEYRRLVPTVPALILQGADDGCLAPAFVRIPPKFRAVISVELLPGVGHFPAQEAPELVAEQALRFLDVGE
jgi:pimeloyl-ACP methyl ester carboxylesterase